MGSGTDTVNKSVGSGAVRRSLGRQLRALREAAGKSPGDVAATKLASRDKLWRIEKGKSPVKQADVMALGRLYGASAEETDALIELSLKTTMETFYEDFSDVTPNWFNTYRELESAASVISTYDPELIHGLLQTPEYARALFEASLPVMPPDVVELRIESRMRRKDAVFSDTHETRLNAVLSEGAVLREIGGPDVLADQLAYLRDRSQTNQVSVRVLPWQSGAHAAHDGPFTLLEFADPDEPTIAYLENRIGARYLERPEQVQSYGEVFAAITRQSIPLEEYTR